MPVLVVGLCWPASMQLLIDSKLIAIDAIYAFRKTKTTKVRGGREVGAVVVTEAPVGG